MANAYKLRDTIYIDGIPYEAGTVLTKSEHSFVVGSGPQWVVNGWADELDDSGAVIVPDPHVDEVPAGVPDAPIAPTVILETPAPAVIPEPTPEITPEVTPEPTPAVIPEPAPAPVVQKRSKPKK
jgi:hypothetical protein